MTKDLNSLPPEIIKQILCNINSNDLLKLKKVCPYWDTLISSMTQIQTLPCPDTMTSNALNIFELWDEDDYDIASLSLHHISYSIKSVISIPLINTLTDDSVTILDLVGYHDILNIFKKYAEIGGGPKDVIGTGWKSILGMTGLDYSVDKLRDLDFNDPFVASFMCRYSWYTYETCEMQSTNDIGIITLYPDNQTFTIFLLM